MQHLLLLGFAGALGALTRHGMSLAVNGAANVFLGRTDFPWGIFLVNVLGCFLFGVVWELAAVRHLLSDSTRTVLLVGFMGSFTTFSTLVFDTNRLWDSAHEILLLLNLGGQILLGIVALRLGFWCVRAL